MRPSLQPHLLLIAKAPVAGRSKTRLCPPCRPAQAAAVAEAALADTLAAVARVAGVRPLLVLDGTPGRWLPRGTAVIRQRGTGLDKRLAAAFDDAGGPALLIGMDTPHASADLLAGCIDSLMTPGVDAVLGAALDGGWWAAGLRRPRRDAFLGVPMSTAHTGELQRRRFARLGLAVADLPQLGDVDTWEDALSVAGACPGGRFAAAVGSVASSLVAQ